MRRKKLIVSGLIILVLMTATLAFLYAQKGYLFHKPVATEKIIDTEEEQEAGEDIGNATGDDPWQEIAKLVAAYYHKKGISFTGIIKLIDDNGEKEKIVEEYPFEYTTINGEFYYSLGKMEFVYKKNLVLVADHANKIIALSSMDTAARKSISFFDINEFKRLMEERKATAIVTQLDNQKMLTIDNIEDPQVNGYRVYYDPETYQISKILVGMLRLSPLEMDEGNGIEGNPDKEEKDKNNGDAQTAEEEIETYTYYLEMIYTGRKILDMRENEFYPENKFIRTTNKKIELTAAYAGYELANNDNSQNDMTGKGEEQ